jgi:hypothetical protein
VTAFEALKTYKFDAHRTDEMAGLFMSLVATAFACNYRRAASLQWGDAYDSTIYDVPSNARQWKFSYISHRMQSDSASGSDQTDPTAAAAHAEVDALRMKRLAVGLDQFKARKLVNQSFVMWTNQYAEGPSHSFQNIPHIIWGNGGGFLKQGAYVDRPERHQQPPPQHADQRRPAGHPYHRRELRRRHWPRHARRPSRPGRGQPAKRRSAPANSERTKARADASL